MRDKKREDKQNRKRKAGFTLVEMLVVITILGILATAGIVGLVKHIETARITKTRTLISDIDKAINIFAMQHNGKIPDSLEELVEGEDPLLDPAALNDAWATPFRYTKQNKKWTITSAGPDLEIGTGDDITN